ncbi:MAG TPA: transcriptional regulator [Bacteroidia bacterium]|jgi:DNA-binding transcriptional ArsR family regulator|nr:transcriptional regulator [Bacteroidia bacterium]HQF27028.1 transcriptional regulator [Bacteroidia bacterium]HQK96956.1 transcriptional regulator [Bacteroidia bacterium]
MFKDLDPLLHQQLRLSVISLLVSTKEAEFGFLKDKTNATAGNLSVQLNKLADAGYITIAKSFRDNYPLTTCKITQQGISAFENYVSALQDYLKSK